MTLVWRPGFQFDADASTYIEAVEAADTQALETGVRYAINDFVIGCKNDGIWDAIKASCILAGARTLTGALVPLVGTAPTNIGFLVTEYNRKTGVRNSNDTPKAINTNRANNADPQNNQHVSTYITEQFGGTIRYLIAAETSEGGTTNIYYTSSTSSTFFRSQTSVAAQPAGRIDLGLAGVSRNSSSFYTARGNGVSYIVNQASQTSSSSNIFVGAANFSGTPIAPSLSRFSFYSIGESLDLALLDTRVSALITAIGAAIP